MSLLDTGTRQLGAEMSYFAYSEATWGTTPGAPDYLFLPLETWSVAHTTDRRESKPFYGIMAKKHGRRFKPRSEGSLGGGLYGDVIDEGSGEMSKAEWLLTKVFGDETGPDIPSFGIMRQESITNAGKRFPGLRMNQFTLQGSADAGRVEWNASVIGLPEVQLANGGYQSVPNNLHLLSDFEYADCEFTIAEIVDGVTGSANAFCFENFTWTRNLGLKPRYGSCNAGPTSINRTMVDTQYNFRIEKKNNDWDTARRLMTGETEFAVVMTLKGLHSGTGGSGTEYTVVTVTLPRCQLLNPQDADTFDDVTAIDVTTEVMKPDSASAQVSIAYTEE